MDIQKWLAEQKRQLQQHGLIKGDTDEDKKCAGNCSRCRVHCVPDPVVRLQRPKSE